MKKLLELLGTIAIASSTVPTVIATSSLQKEIKKVGDLDELNWTHLTKIRNKRNTENDKTKHVFKTYGADKPTEEQIKNRVKEKNQSVDITKIKVENITANSAVISITGFSGKLTIDFTVDKSVPINIIIKNTDLGEIDINQFGGGNYDEALFKHFLKQLNPQLDINKIKIKKTHLYGGTITSIDTSIYTGEINFNYSIPLRLYIEKKELGLIRTDGVHKPTEQQIKDKLKELNRKLETVIDDFEIKDITFENAEITFKRQDLLSGSAKVNFISNVNLNKIITNTTLGEFKTSNLSNPTEQQIKDKLKELYPSIDINKINILNITLTSAQIKSNNLNFYTGNINVNYIVSIESLNW